VREKKTRRDPVVGESRDRGEAEENEARSESGGKSRQR